MTQRAVIVDLVVDLARRSGRPLFVGNGFLSREVMSSLPPGIAAVLPLQGGMGLAAGVAAGYLLARPEPGALVLEGDGNHLMGWGCAQFAADQGINLIHIVCLNGCYASAGGWAVPGRLRSDRVTAAAEVLGYQQALTARDEVELRAVLAMVSRSTGPVLIYVDEQLSASRPARQAYRTAQYAQWLAAGRTVTEEAT
jgi:thiamine pyrophosphate-dependent acetolactate synthase large subunit-like protein